jgi:FhaA, N-terminal domain/FHA domain
MSMLKSIESRIAGLVEGTFSRAFKSEVRPVEIARKLGREMEEHKSYSVSRMYAPNEYRVYLSARDRERFADEEGYLTSELAGYLLEHARRENLALRSRPVVEFVTDERLGLGEFGIQTRTSAPPAADPRQPPPRQAPAPAPEPDPGGRTMVYSTSERMAEPLRESAASEQRTAMLLMDGKRLVIGAAGVTLGRSRQCDVTVDDPNVSRTHAEIRARGGSWVVTDLGSTNGSRLNGRPLQEPTVLKPGDEIELGTTTLEFSLG